MNCDIPPRKVWIPHQFLGIDRGGLAHGYAFAVQSIKGRALSFHVLLQSGAHYRQVPLHWLLHKERDNFLGYSLPLLQLWDCYSYRPIVTAFDFLKDYSCNAILKDKTVEPGQYWCTIDWLPDSETQAGYVLQPDQNKCAHLILLENGQIAALPTNRVAFRDAFFIGSDPHPETYGYKTTDEVHHAEDADRWSVADTEDTYY